ncbi:MAG: hypothetical protein M1821_007162 [Bathelium mastoideum]|nr:MAG: hypothetical protein M1821_007162 [Bathelium mastoideum]KAI9694670.1 MAG: hypothetical protein M1822_000286 [Bathelium mastoideum]
MSLKKALGRFRGGSNASSDDEGSRNRSPAVGSPARSSFDSPRQSGEHGKRSLDSPRLNGLIHPRTDESVQTNGSSHRRSMGPIRSVKTLLNLDHHDEGELSDSSTPLNRDGEKMSKNQLRKHERQASQEARKKETEEREEAARQRQQDMEERAQRELSPEDRALYGSFPVNNYAGTWAHEKRQDLRDIASLNVGEEVIFRARIHHVRKVSSKLVFFLLRQQTVTVQGVLQEHGRVSKFFVYWAEHLDVEDIVLVKGIIQEPKAKQGEITGASIHNVEVSIHELHIEGQVREALPFSVHEAEISEVKEEQEQTGRVVVSERARLGSRILDLRTTASQSIFRIQSGMCNLFRTYLDSQGFIEIHTPKLQGGATESGASVFKVDYFGRPAFLAQSPQLAKQMSISADFGRVYEIGPVFRAENSNTHRHMTEFTGMDLEMAIDEHYHEVLRMLDNTFKFIFRGIYDRYRHEIDTIKEHFPHEDLVWLDETPRIPFAQAIRMLNESGYTDEKGKKLDENEDIGTKDEIALGRLIKDKYKTDFYILDKFPASARPFYTMPDPDDPTVTNSFDIFLRGQEILSGAQRIHDAKTLVSNMERMKVDPKTMDEYIQGFEWGAPPHGGGGIGMERMLMLLLSLGDIRHATLYPRDPRSFPTRPAIKALRHPDASTLHPPWQGKDRAAANIAFQPLEQLIANYGDASNTSWLEPRIQVWRDDNTGAAVGFCPMDHFAITVGDPLCHVSQYTKTIAGYLRFISKERHLKPLWLLAGPDAEEVLATRFNWRTFSVAAEQRLDPSTNPAAHEHDVQRKIRHAEKEGVKIHDYPIDSPPSEDLRKKIDGRIQDWLNNRKGKQVHLTDVHPWQDIEHRQYHTATDKDGQIVCFVVMAQLSPDHGWQVKFALDLPGAPGGSIEMIVTHALKFIAQNGATNVTFGGGATSQFRPGHNLKGARVKVLSKAYHAIATELHLTNKSEFREKLGAKEDPIYVCYPPHGLGPSGVKAIMNFFEDDPST